MSAQRPLYDGPIIDAHHHLWDLSGGRYPWLTKPEAAIGALGDIVYGVAAVDGAFLVRSGSELIRVGKERSAK